MNDEMINAAFEAVIADMGKTAKGFKARKFAPKPKPAPAATAMDNADDQPEAPEISAEELEQCLGSK